MTAARHPVLLIVEDDLALQKQIKWSLDRFESVTASDRETALSQFRRHLPPVVTMDLGLPPDRDSVSEGFKLLEQLLEAAPEAKVIVLTGQNEQSNALRAVALGGYDFLAKPFDPDVLGLIVERALRLSELQSENRRLQALHQPDALAGMITRDARLMRIGRTLEKVAPSNATVMLLGESGTGKEVLAQALHQASRRSGRFVAVNCAAIPENLLESELFGHEKGAFTGAGTQRIGKFEQCNHGTIFLDEIGDMTPATQTKILRVLQSGAFERVGGNQPVQVDVRIIAATNKPLEQAVAAREFREDLFYRLNVVRIQMPALRERRDDIRLLVNYFLKKFSQSQKQPPKAIAPDALAALERHPWPGNVRELENMVQRALVMAKGDAILSGDLPPEIATSGATGAVAPSAAGTPAVESGEPDVAALARRLFAWARGNRTLKVIPAVERELIIQALSETQGNQVQAAKLLGITRATLRKRVEKFKITRELAIK